MHICISLSLYIYIYIYIHISPGRQSQKVLIAAAQSVMRGAPPEYRRHVNMVGVNMVLA